MENQKTFWDQFKAMVADPFQRRKLVEYFDKCVQECTQNPKPMRIAFIGHRVDFILAMGNTVAANASEVSIGMLVVTHCTNDDDVYGKDFDAFFLDGTMHNVPSPFYDAAFYLSGFNVPKLTEKDFLSLLNEYKPIQHV